MEREGLGPVEWAVLAIGGLLTLAVLGVWGGAMLAAISVGSPTTIGLPDAASALKRLPESVADPAMAWPPRVAARLPGPVGYWACTMLWVSCLVAAGVAGLRYLGRSRVGTVRRRPLGVDARPAFATRRDLAPLLVAGPEPGRFVVGSYGRRFVASETTTYSAARRRGRRGDRGAIALVGPSRSGKTTAAVGGILEWDGPALLSSVKADLLGVTAGWRSTLGDVVVYDPTGSTSVGDRARWSPLLHADTVPGAQRAARALCEAAPKGGVEGGLDFWLAQAEILLSGLLFVAARTGRDMGTVCNWVLLQDRPGELGPGEVRTALDVLLDDDPDVVAGAVEASRGLLAIWEMDDRTRASVYATTQTVVWPWADPTVAASSRGSGVDLEWLLAGANTLYLSAPIEDQQRLAPAFGGLLNDLLGQVFRRVARTGEPLDPALLVVIDEAGNTPLRALPQYASTLAGLGVQLVTIWQSLAQIEATYRRHADTILTNHLTKAFFAGLSDPASLRYVAQVLGDAEVDTRSRSNAERLGRGGLSLASTRVPLAPPHVLRQMRPGEALLLHGTLPPAHVRARPFYRDPALRERAAMTIATPAEVGR